MFVDLQSGRGNISSMAYSGFVEVFFFGVVGRSIACVSC